MPTYTFTYTFVTEVEADNLDEANYQADANLIEAWRESGTLSETFTVTISK